MKPFGGLHHYIGPFNERELQQVHDDARTIAIVYISAVALVYLACLGGIFVHYMNSSYGTWTWTLDDVWTEVKPTCCEKDRHREGE